MEDKLLGKVAIVTGGARGMGASHAEALARAGAQVVIADVLDAPGAALAASLSEQGLAVVHRRLDVSSEEGWTDLLSAVEGEFGHVGVLVNNAGIDATSRVDTCSTEEWTRIMSVNLTGVFFGIRAVVPGMRSLGGGSIINVASQWAHIGGAMEGFVAYVTSKATILGLTKNSSLSLGRYNIRVNSISPGGVKTEMLETGPHASRELERVPLGRFADPAEISPTVVLLASDDSSYISGADILVDGGLNTA